MNDQPIATHVLLGKVITVADHVLNAPALRVGGEDMHAVLTLLTRRHEKPSEHGKRRTHFAMMLMDALLHVMTARRSGDADAVKWEMIASAIVPCVRADVIPAIEDARAEMADTH